MIYQVFSSNGKSALKTIKLSYFESDLLETNQDIASQSCEILQLFVMWVAQTCPATIQTSVIFTTLQIYLRLPRTYNFQIWQFN